MLECGRQYVAGISSKSKVLVKWSIIEFTVIFISLSVYPACHNETELCLIAAEGAKPVGIGLDEPDRAIDPFRAGVTDSVLAVVEPPTAVLPESSAGRAMPKSMVVDIHRFCREDDF